MDAKFGAKVEANMDAKLGVKVESKHGAKVEAKHGAKQEAKHGVTIGFESKHIPFLGVILGSKLGSIPSAKGGAKDKACGFFYCSTLSQLFQVFTPYSCQWRDCALGELLISLGNIIMPIILCVDVYALYIMIIRLSGRNMKNNSCKNVEK